MAAANAVNIPDQYLEALVEISREINSIQESGILLERTLEIALKQLAAERGFILLTDSESGEMQPRASRNIDSASISDISEISNSSVQKVMTEKRPMLTFDTLSDEEFDRTQSVVLHKISSIACVPLLLKGELIGVIYIDSRGQKAAFNRQSIDFLSAFANQAAVAIQNARLMESLRRENKLLREEFQRMHAFKEIVGSSKSMTAVFQLMSKVVNNSTTVLVVGETGTGKEMVARAIHYNGIRKDKPFVAVNCAAIPDNLLESELYGYKKGAFTGATSDKSGLIETANHGTIFLDEISEIPLNLQAKLLRFLQEKEIMPVGGTEQIAVDVRVIAASNRDLAEEVREGRLREDLYYRLNIIPIQLPPLRERKKDIPLLAQHFLEKHRKAVGKEIKAFQHDALEKLLEYGWAGNVRELENVIERAVVMASHDHIVPDDIMLRELQDESRIDAGMKLDDISRVLLEKTLRAFEGNKTKTAEAMGVSLRWVHYKSKEWDL